MMSIRQKAILQRDACERLARLSEKKMRQVGLSDGEKLEASEEAKACWQMSRGWADTVADAEFVRPRKFSGKQPRGKAAKTLRRDAFVASKRLDFPDLTHKKLALEIFESDDAQELWPNLENSDRFRTIYQFIRRLKTP